MLNAFKTAFALCIAFIIYFLVTQVSHLSIDTSLKDLAPQFANDADTRFAVDHVSTSLEKRFVLLAEGKQATNAVLTLSKQINALDNVQVAPDSSQVLERVLAFYKPYRFHLLSEAQRQQLQGNTPNLQTLIANEAHQKIFQITASPRLLNFDEDPLGWQSDFLLSRLSGLSQSSATTTDTQQTHYVVFNLQAEKPSLPSQQSLLKSINQVIADTQKEFDVSIKRSGVFFFATEAASQSKSEISFITSISMVAVFTLLVLIFRNIGPVILPFISIALGVSFAMAVTHSVFGAIHVLTIVFGASLIGVVIDYSLHFFYHKSSELSSHKNHRHLLNALLLSLTTSLIGYAALSMSDLSALKKVALFSCCGLFMAWLSVVCLGDYMTKNMRAPRQQLLHAFVSTLSQPLKAFSAKTAAATFFGLVLCGAGIALLKPPTSDDPRLFFNASDSLLAQEAYVSTRISDFEPGRYILLKSTPDRSLQDISNEFLQTIDRQTDLKPEHFVSLLNWVPSRSSQQANYNLLESIYLPNGAIEQLLSKLGADNAIALALRKSYHNAKSQSLDLATTAKAFETILPPLWLEHNNQEMAFILIRKGTDTRQLHSIAEQVPGLDYMNTLAAATSVLKEQRQSASTLLLLAYLLVAGLLVFRFKRLSAIWMISIPIASTSILLIGFFLTGNTLNLFHTMALFLVLGLGMDYSIFVKEMRENVSITHQSIFLSAITSLLSFGLLAVSSIPVVSAFGITLLIGNLSNLIGAFIYSEQLSYYEQ